MNSYLMGQAGAAYSYHLRLDVASACVSSYNLNHSLVNLQVDKIQISNVFICPSRYTLFALRA